MPWSQYRVVGTGSTESTGWIFHPGDGEDSDGEDTYPGAEDDHALVMQRLAPVAGAGAVPGGGGQDGEPERSRRRIEYEHQQNQARIVELRSMIAAGQNQMDELQRELMARGESPVHTSDVDEDHEDALLNRESMSRPANE